MILNKKLLFILSLLTLLTAQNGVFAVSDEARNDFEQAKKIAETKKITGAFGQNFSYIENSSSNKIFLIFETFSSRTKYKVITPIVEIKSNSIFANCIYIKAVDNPTGLVSVGGFCHPLSEITQDSMENFMSDINMISYSSSAQWLKKVKKTDNCELLSGLIYGDFYFVRCQQGDEDTLTENITITIFSSAFKKLFSITGYEFAPIKEDNIPKKLIFWGLKRESSHEIIEIEVPAE